jgi:aspartyl-tRNA(Asn)/glutamyl-tRNA(Gln) amidotransferase subunit C
MAVTPEEIYRTATLARLKIEETKVPEYVQNLNNLLKLAGSMNEADTASIDPMSHPLEGQKQRFRPDNITETNQRDLFLENAPQTAEGLFLVPPVIE